MTPETGVIFVQLITIIIALIWGMHQAEKVDLAEANAFAEELAHEGTKTNLKNRQELVDDLYGNIQVLELREMELKDQLKDVMTESDFPRTG